MKKQQAQEPEHPLGLVLDDGLSEQQWLDMGTELGAEARASAFRIGDWLLYAEEHLDAGVGRDGRYVQAEEKTGLANGTLRNYAYVCRSVPMSRRRDTLTFGHHQVVASLDFGEQESLLAEATTDGWSVVKLREVVREGQPTELVLMDVPRAVAASWTSAAKEADQPIWKWLHDQIECAALQLEQAAGFEAVAA